MMAQQFDTRALCALDLHEHAETDVPDDDTSSRTSFSPLSCSEGSSVSEQKKFTRRFVWADADSSDDDDTSSQISASQRSSSEGSSVSEQKPFTRRFVWADADSSDDEVDLTSFVVCSSVAGSRESMSGRNPHLPRVPPGCHQPFHLGALPMPCGDSPKPKAATEPVATEHDSRTTLIMKNLPAGCLQDGLCRILDEAGFAGLYNFIYVPINLRDFVAFRYCFVNFERNEDAVKAMATFDGFSGWAEEGEKACEVEWSGTQEGLYRSTGWSGDKQGLRTLVERYRNSPLMHESVPEVLRPALFKNGVRIAFPAPTKKVKAPKLRPVQ